MHMGYLYALSAAYAACGKTMQQKTNWAPAMCGTAESECLYLSDMDGGMYAWHAAAYSDYKTDLIINIHRGWPMIGGKAFCLLLIWDHWFFLCWEVEGIFRLPGAQGMLDCQ